MLVRLSFTLDVSGLMLPLDLHSSSNFGYSQPSQHRPILQDVTNFNDAISDYSDPITESSSLASQKDGGYLEELNVEEIKLIETIMAILEAKVRSWHVLLCSKLTFCSSKHD